MKASITTIFHHYIIPLINPFSLHLCYFLVLSLAGFLSLKVSKTRTSETPSNLDLFFTSVSAATASSMTTVEMEVFSNDQLIVMTILMLLGGEVFTSMLGLHLRSCEFPSIQNPKLESSCSIDSIELGMIKPPISTIDDNNNNHEIISNIITTSSNNSSSFKYNKNKSIKLLGYVVLGYIIIVHLVGSTLITMYMSLTPSALNVLNNKGLVLQTFSFFMVVSTFSSCGFAPTNENMMIFRMNNPGLLLILLPYTFVGNTMYPLFLRLVIWVLEKLSRKKEFNYILKNYEELEYGHLMSSKKCWYLGGTTIVFLVLQIVVFCGMDWSSQVMEGMSSYEKFVASLFQTANTRHSGESVVDISQLSQAVLVLFTIMM
nr:high-affinity K+ transporter 1;3 [Bienertia sinuspersici]